MRGDYLAGKQIMYDPTKGLVYLDADAEANANRYIPIAFYSADSHCSILKLLIVLGIKPVAVESNADGSINAYALAKKAEPYVDQGHPILVCFNYGTTFKGAYDDVEKAHRLLKPILQEYRLYARKVCYDSGKCVQRNGFWFHMDGALGAAYMPYLKKAHEQGRFADPVVPEFDFRQPIHSISMSGHKWIGAPWPCGIYMTRTKLQMRPRGEPELHRLRGHDIRGLAKRVFCHDPVGLSVTNDRGRANREGCHADEPGGESPRDTCRREKAARAQRSLGRAVSTLPHDPV